MNKLEIKITTHYHSGVNNKDRLGINNTKETYNDNCGGTGGRSEF